MNIRRITLATLVITAVGLTACSSETKRSIDIGGTTSVGDTASTLLADATTAPGNTTAPATAPPVTAPPATVPPATAPPATPPPATAPPATAAPGFSLYDEVSPPGVPSGHTDPVASSGILANGVYWVEYLGGETITPSIEVHQAFFGAECVSQAAAAGDECLNDIYVPNDPSREIDDLPFTNGVYLTVTDSSTQKSYWITPDELRSVRAASPSDPAPAGFSFVPFPWRMTVQGGQILKFEQVWVP